MWGCSTRIPCPVWLQRSWGLALTELQSWQMAFMGISAYLNAEPEPGDASAKALLATLRKRLSLSRNLVSPHARYFQVRMQTMPYTNGVM